MDVYRTEEEQVDYIKRWWKANGSSLLVGIGLAVAVTVGWQSWQQSRQAKAESASLLFAEFQDAARAALATPAKAAGDESGKKDENPQRATFEHLATQLKADYPSSAYAVLTAMMLARDAVEQGDAAKAETELRWALDKTPGEAMTLVIKLRLARVLAMKGDVDAGLTVLDGIEHSDQNGAVQEVKGDLFLQKGDQSKARAAYESALSALDSKAANRPLLQVKLDDLAVAAE